MEYKVGQKVIVTGVTPNGSFEGCKGVIIRDSEFHDWIVDVTFPDGNHDELGYDEFELTATAQPAASATAADGGEVAERLEVYRDIFHDVIAGHLESTPQVMAERGLYLLAHIDDLRVKLVSVEAALAVAVNRVAWADEILDTVEETAPKDWAGSTDPLPHDWYHAGQLVREYRAEYPKMQATS